MAKYGHWHRMTGPTIGVHTPILCEKEPSISQYNTDDERRVTCPKCWKILGQQKIDDLAKQGTLIRWEPVPAEEKQSWVRSRYIVKIGDEDAAEIELQNGWGRKWSFVFLNDSYGRRYGEFLTKEQALAALPKLIEEGRVLTPAIMAAQKEERRQREEQAKADQERWRAEREQEQRERTLAAEKNRKLLQLAIDIVARHDNDTEGAREARLLLESIRDKPESTPL